MRCKMKILLMLLVLFAGKINFAQENFPFIPSDPKGKLAQLEKVKLIETLKMDEETTLRFFARRTEFLDKIQSLNKNSMDLIDKLEKSFGENKLTKSEYKNLIKEFNNNDEQMFKEKMNFINSLDDILSEEQIAKMIVFEKKFKEEIRKILAKGRNH